ncbi:MAG: hypothetical protein ACYC4R_10600 [Anaerolineae bacterium]
MAKPNHAALIADLVALLCPEDQAVCVPLIDCLLALGYLPQRQKVQGYVLAFKNNALGQTIAKIAAPSGRDGRATVSVKFYACKHPPRKFVEALRHAIESTPMQYRCCGCGVCGAQEQDRGYRYTDPTGAPFVRCGAYVIRIPDLVLDDVEDAKRLLREQHAYFLARTP